MLLRYIFLIFCFVGYLFSNTTTAQSISQNTQEQIKKILPKDDAQISSGKCEWKCRSVSADYVTQISGFDFKQGITHCRIYARTNLDEPLIYNANQQNLVCLNQLEQNMTKNPYTSEIEKIKQMELGISSKIAYNPNNQNITMSTFLSSLVTLNPNIIDREKTNSLGALTLKDGLEVASRESITGVTPHPNGVTQNFVAKVNKVFAVAKNIFEKNTIGSIESGGLAGLAMDDAYSKTSAIDGFNKANMAYFSDLFLNMEKVYQHLQILLFIVVGGFYLTSIGANKLQIYLENRGESAGNQPYLHKFYIPLLMVGTFFMPIPEANGMAHSTIMQNTIRYFTLKSVEVADMASAIGAKTYMDKIYKSLGGVNSEAFLYLIQDLETNKFKTQQGELLYKNTCSKRFEKPASNKQNIGYLKLSDKEKEELKEKSNLDRNNIAGTAYDITLEACMYLESQINQGILEAKKNEAQLKSIVEFYNGNDAKIKLIGMDSYFAVRESQLGWINSIIIPSSVLLAEMTTYNDYSMYKSDMETATKQNQKTIEGHLETQDIDTSELDEVDSGLIDGVLAYIAGKLVWLMLPGAEQIKEFYYSMYDKIKFLITAFVSFVSSKIPVVGTITGALVSTIITSLAKTPIVYYTTAITIEHTYEKIPLLVCTTASVIACVSYLVSLCKYFYISPFVVAFALATKRMNKIVDFLIAGIAIFFKPILIVMFIYLALFISTLINELFVFFSAEQFYGAADWNPITTFVSNAILGLLKIFGILASSYIMWKLIVSGPAWAMSMVGIDGKQDDMIAQGIEQRLANRAFVA